MKIIATIILTKNGETLKQKIKKTKQQLTEKVESTETFKNTMYDEECKTEIEEIKKPI